MKSPEVSIIIPCFNNGKYLSEMIHCFQSQTIKNWELIIVDDKSTDDTPIFVKEFEKNDNRIKLLIRDREPKGSVVCRNIGFENSKGKYIVHLDADDLVSNEFLENRVNFMNQNLDLDYASFPAKSFTNQIKMHEVRKEDKTWGIATNKDLLTCFLNAKYPFSVWNNIYRKKAINKLNWDENVKIYTDFSFIIPVILNGLKHKFSDTLVFDYFYRIEYDIKNTNMCSNFVSSEKSKSTIYLFSKTLNSLGFRADYQKRKKEFLPFIVLHFERLVMDGSIVKLEDYLAFFEKYYSRGKLISLRGIAKISLKCSNIKMRKALLYLLLGLRFGYLNYFEILFVQLKISKFKKNK